MNRIQIEKYLENECSFRDYEFKHTSQWGTVNTPRSIHLLLPDRRDLEDALYVFTRDGYSNIIIYLEGVPV